MTDNLRPNRLGAMRHFAWPLLLLTGTLLQACGPTQNAAGSKLRVYAADLEGAAKSCEAPKLTPTAGKTADAAIKVGNDGGWCGLVAYEPGPKPYDAGLLMSRPNHGTVLIHGVGDETRIDYTPDRGFTGTDAFSVKLIPGDAEVHVSATVVASTK